MLSVENLKCMLVDAHEFWFNPRRAAPLQWLHMSSMIQVCLAAEWQAMYLGNVHCMQLLLAVQTVPYSNVYTECS